VISPYAYYAATALQWYYKMQPKPERFYSRAVANNWNACEMILSDCDEKMNAILKDIYLSKDTKSDAVYEASKKYNTSQEAIWTMMSRIEKRFAQERGLI